MRSITLTLIGAAALLAGCSKSEDPDSAGEPAVGIVAHLAQVEDTAFTDIDIENGPWNGINATVIGMLPQNITTPSKAHVSIANLEVRAVHNGRWLGVALSWEDDTQDEANETSVFSDAVAMSLPLGDPKATSPFMGAKGAGVEVNYWKALWQRDVDYGYQDVTDSYPRTVSDGYHGFSREKTGEIEPVSYVSVGEIMANPEARLALPAIALGNPMARLERKSPVEQLIAEGFGTLTVQQEQNSTGKGMFRDGRWTVVIARPLDTGDEVDFKLVSGTEHAINFAVWDGGHGDVGARKNYAMFTPLYIESEAAE